VADLRIVFRLPVAGWPRAVFESDHVYDGGCLRVGGQVVASATSRTELRRGVEGPLPDDQGRVTVRLTMDGAMPRLLVSVDGREALPEDELPVPTAPSAWGHAGLALAASAAGFVASYLYLDKSTVLQSLQAWKMAYHMAGWHLLLTFTLFPASVWGGRVGIRAVQATSLLFFLIHLGIALANVVGTQAAEPGDFRIGVWNAVSGAFFLAAVVYGNKAYRDMDPAQVTVDAPAVAAGLRSTKELR